MTIAISTEGMVSSGGSGSSDTTAPVVTIISPTPGASPGALGGFPADKALADVTPIVVSITDLSPGIQYLMVYVNLDGVEEIVYRRGQFRGIYIDGSFQGIISGGVQLTIFREGGWTVAKFIRFGVDAVDASGNITG